MTTRFGLLGAANITPQALIEPANERDDVELVVVAARDRSRAEAFAAEHNIANVVDDYAAVVNHPEVNAVFNPLPMHLHHDWTIAALEAGKDVLCEKPFAANADEARAMVAAAERTGCHLMEAFHWRYHPLAARIGEIVGSGRLGTITDIAGRFNIQIADRSDIRWTYDCAGGSLMDLGCYPIQWVRFVAGSEPTITSASATIEAETDAKIDAAITASMTFDGGVTASIECSMIATDWAVDLTVTGTDGTLVVQNPLAPQMGHNIIETSGGERTESQVETTTTYAHQLAAFVALRESATPVPTGGADAIANMEAIDAIYDAAGLPRRGL